MLGGVALELRLVVVRIESCYLVASALGLSAFLRDTARLLVLLVVDDSLDCRLLAMSILMITLDLRNFDESVECLTK